MKLSDFDNAIRYFDDFSGSDQLLQARAYSLTGDAYIENDDFINAIKYFKKASDYKENKGFTPRYLVKLALAYEKSGNLQDAANTLGIIIDKYQDSGEIQKAKKHKARLEGLIVQ